MRKVLLAAALGALAGLISAWFGLFPSPWLTSPPTPRELPLPHQVSKYPGGTSLRLAMVHDLLHERYPRHGHGYYRARNAAARKEWDAWLSKHPSGGLPDEHVLALLDDLGVGLDHLGEHAEAARVLRDKLQRQQASGPSGRALYTSYANLGTFLIHGKFRLAQQGNVEAKSRLEEGLQYIRKSIEVNPQAHFGREVWQVVAVEYFLKVQDKPELLGVFDFIGDRLDLAIDPSERRCYRLGSIDNVDYSLRNAPSLDTMSQRDRDFAREGITAVGAEEGWKKTVTSSQVEPAPFDEPVLGIIGMWRFGGGPNPHFALAIGEIMVRVGQRYIAWCAYERAIEMKDRFWPDAALSARLAEHCRQRQALIESQLGPAERDGLRSRFQGELAHGRQYQQDYQRYEEQRLAEGASIDDPHFYDDFDSSHPPIASPVGRADFVLIEYSGLTVPNPFPAMVLGAGLFALLTALLRRPRCPSAHNDACAGQSPSSRTTATS
jgi:hypothetical protein